MIRVAIACVFVALVLIVAACVEESDAGDASGRSADVLNTLAAAVFTSTPEPTPLRPSPTITPTDEPAATFTPSPIENTATATPADTPTAEPAATFTPTQVENTATATPVDTPTETAPPTVEPEDTERVVGTEVGDTAPGFVLASAAGPEFALESLRGEKSVVVIFYRAFW